ncbi:hypothetical protein GQ457_10G010690 [Hibiscus cannabinus]
MPGMINPTEKNAAVLWSCTEATQISKAQKASKQSIGPVFPVAADGREYQQEGRIKVNIKDLKPKRIKDCLECKISQRNLNQPRKSAQAGPVVSCRDIPFVIQLKQIIEAPR